MQVGMCFGNGKAACAINSHLDYWIHWHAPIGSRCINHQIDHHRNNILKDRCAVSQLVAIGSRVPCGSTMHELIAQNIQTVEQHGENLDRIPLAKGVVEPSASCFEPFVPILRLGIAVVVSPERCEDVAIFEEEPDRTGKS